MGRHRVTRHRASRIWPANVGVGAVVTSTLVSLPLALAGSAWWAITVLTVAS